MQQDNATGPAMYPGEVLELLPSTSSAHSPAWYLRFHFMTLSLKQLAALCRRMRFFSFSWAMAWFSRSAACFCLFVNVGDIGLQRHVWVSPLILGRHCWLRNGHCRALQLWFEIEDWVYCVWWLNDARDSQRWRHRNWLPISNRSAFYWRHLVMIWG